MIKRILLQVGLVLFSTLAFTQSPQVPSRMTFADIKLKITDSGRKAIQKEVDAITQSPRYFYAKVEKANIYFPMIERAYREEGVPDDFKYLALQESALIPDAVSTSNAVGYWQFKDFTAVEVGLRVDKHIDERKSIYASSLGAARYMKSNNNYFDNWLFALQAYQMGAGAAMKVLDKKNYGAKSLVITDKTYWYVKTFLAHKIAYEPVVGKSKPTVDLVGYYNGVGKTLHEIAKETNVELTQLEHYNLWLRKGKIPNDRDYMVLLPNSDYSPLIEEPQNSKPKIVARKLPEVDEKASERFPVIDKEYHAKFPLIVKINGLQGVIAKEGNALMDIAKAGMLDIGKLLNYNDIEIDHQVVPGEVYYFHKKKSKAKIYYHVLADGESLWAVAQKYGIRLSKLKMKNRIVEGEELKPGRVLWLRHIRPVNVPIGYKKYKKAQSSTPQPPRKEGPVLIDTVKLIVENEPLIDSLNTVSYPISNPIVNDSISTGELGNLEPIDYEADNTESLLEHVHIIKAGETLYRISKIYNVEVMKIVEWNSLDLTKKINPGEELIIKTTPERMTKADIQEVQESNTISFTTHEVSAGETLYSISRKYGVSIEQIQQWNEREDYTLSVGDTLKVVRQ